MSDHTSKLFDSLSSELAKNCNLKVIKLFKRDAVEKSQPEVKPKDTSDMVSAKQSIKVCQKYVTQVQQFTSLVAMVVEMDKHYTQSVADTLVFLDEKSSQCRLTLAEKVRIIDSFMFIWGIK